MTLLVDAGPLIADADRSDPHHAEIRAFLESTTEALLVPITVLPEVCYLLERRLGGMAELAFVRALARDEITVQPVNAEDLERAADLLEKYGDLRLGFVDASVVALAERLNITRLLTLDRRHFSVVRPRHARAFELLP